MSVISCPFCRYPLTVHESQAGQVVTCPTCRNPLTVPGIAPGSSPGPSEVPTPFEMPDEASPRTRPAKRRAPPRPSPWPLLIVGVLAGLALAGVIAYFAMGRKDKSDEGAKEASKESAKKDTQPAISTSGKALGDAAIEKIKKATVLIRVEFADGKSATGSGFFVPGPGHVVTNSHVVSPGATKIEVVIESGTPRSRAIPATLLGDDSRHDLALLQVAAKTLPEPLFLGDTTGLKETHELYVFGFPLGERLGTEITVNKSSVSSLRKSGDNPEIQMNGGVNPGNSGGPVVDSSGKVVGVVVASIRGTQIDFAIPSETVKGFLQRLKR